MRNNYHDYRGRKKNGKTKEKADKTNFSLNMHVSNNHKQFIFQSSCLKLAP